MIEVFADKQYDILVENAFKYQAYSYTVALMLSAQVLRNPYQ